MSVNDSRYHIKQLLLWLKPLKLTTLCFLITLFNLWIIHTMTSYEKLGILTDQIKQLLQNIAPILFLLW